MQIKIPTAFEINYPTANKRYYNKNKDRLTLLNILLTASDRYCMYCGKTVYVDRDYTYHMEHSVDQNGNLNQDEDEETFLKHCKFNFSVACPKCNDDCKKIVEKIDFFGKKKMLNCLSRKCSDMCDEYIDARNEYIANNKIILQPLGYSEKGINYDIGYNLYHHFYEPLAGIDDVDIEFFIHNHIRRFRLNDERFSYGIVDAAVDIIDLYNKGVQSKHDILEYKLSRRPDNIIERLFLNRLDEMFSDENVEGMIDYCEMIIVLEALD